MDKRERGTQIQQQIRSVLFLDWDPIGVNDIAPDDEYDAYIGSVYRHLVSGTGLEELSEHLRQLEITQMECPTTPEHRKMVAAKLLQLDVSLGGHIDESEKLKS